ncbi:protein adenylyltransferase SelO family protein [Pelagibacterium xiamenense]|uniref:protein adenylyltransferase SelO family protein n=1 Tax=Pelagibacterium xiamenense TaxID=2901140 RepID=UPI001E452CC0|nr:YdiU family protein [Pelagibacterium xiamenense]
MPQAKFETVHAGLGPDFFDPVEAADFPRTVLRYRNRRWAERVGLGGLSDEDWIARFGWFEPFEGSFRTPLALRYHGHQFQVYNPDLGDGRGFLFAQLRDLEDGRLLDLGTKGSGTTPWSRGGDGRLTLKGGVREVLATEMLEALGVDTSKSFSLIETGESLMRNDEPSPTRSSVLVRLSHSHIRIGTFQRLAYLEDTENIRRLVDHAIAHYYPHLGDLAEAQKVPAFLGAVCEAVAKTGARMIAAGFVHGVLNSDNINITGEAFDYGPWRFLDRYEAGFTAAYFDQGGLYAFGRQPDALAWNLTRLAECLVPLSDIPKLEPALNRFWPAFQRGLALAVLERLALVPAGEDQDAEFTAALFKFLGAINPPFEQVIFDLRGGADAERLGASPAASAYAAAEFEPVRAALSNYQARPGARAHPYFDRARPRTMVIEEMEALWAPIADKDDWSAFEAALEEIAELRAAYAGPADR